MKTIPIKIIIILVFCIHIQAWGQSQQEVSDWLRDTTPPAEDLYVPTAHLDAYQAIASKGKNVLTPDSFKLIYENLLSYRRQGDWDLLRTAEWSILQKCLKTLLALPKKVDKKEDDLLLASFHKFYDDLLEIGIEIADDDQDKRTTFEFFTLINKIGFESIPEQSYFQNYVGKFIYRKQKINSVMMTAAFADFLYYLGALAGENRLPFYRNYFHYALGSDNYEKVQKETLANGFMSTNNEINYFLFFLKLGLEISITDNYLERSLMSARFINVILDILIKGTGHASLDQTIVPTLLLLLAESSNPKATELLNAYFEQSSGAEDPASISTNVRSRVIEGFVGRLKTNLNYLNISATDTKTAFAQKLTDRLFQFSAGKKPHGHEKFPQELFNQLWQNSRDKCESGELTLLRPIVAKPKVANPEIPKPRPTPTSQPRPKLKNEHQLSARELHKINKQINDLKKAIVQVKNRPLDPPPPEPSKLDTLKYLAQDFGYFLTLEFDKVGTAGDEEDNRPKFDEQAKRMKLWVLKYSLEKLQKRLSLHYAK